MLEPFFLRQRTKHLHENVMDMSGQDVVGIDRVQPFPVNDDAVQRVEDRREPASDELFVKTLWQVHTTLETRARCAT